MILYNKNQLILKVHKIKKELLFSYDSYFTNTEHNIFTHTIYGYISKCDANGKILPQNKWYIELPFEPIIQIFDNGEERIWKWNGTRLYYDDERITEI